MLDATTKMLNTCHVISPNIPLVKTFLQKEFSLSSSKDLLIFPLYLFLPSGVLTTRMPDRIISAQSCELLPCACAGVTVDFYWSCCALCFGGTPFATQFHTWLRSETVTQLKPSVLMCSCLDQCLRAGVLYLIHWKGGEVKWTTCDVAQRAARFCSVGDSDWMFFSPAVHLHLVCFPLCQSFELKFRLMPASYSSIWLHPPGHCESGQ